MIVTVERILDLSRLRDAVISGRAREIREAAHITQGDVASVCGVTRGAVASWERGRRVPQERDAALRYLGLLDALERQRREHGGG